MFAQYRKFYQNIYPGNGPLSGAVNPAQTSFNRAAYNNTTNRDNIFNQTDFIYKAFTGPVFHTIAFGGEFGQQSGISLRNTGIFPTGTNTIVANPFAPTYFGSVNFIHQFPGGLSPGVSAADANSDYTLYTTSAYARDTIEITRWLQIIAGARFDRFDESAWDKNTNINRSLVNNNVSPQAAVIVKPIENLSLYYAYSVSYLPAPGDQFSTLSDGTSLPPCIISIVTMFHFQTQTIQDFSSCRAATESRGSRQRSPVMSHLIGSPPSATRTPTRV